MPAAHPPTGRLVDVRGPRSATWVTSAVVGAAGHLSGAPLVGAVATGLALVAALSTRPPASASAVSYLTVRRVRPARTA